MYRKDAAAEPYVRILLYGDPGSTKTRTLGTAAADPRTSPCLMIGAANNPLAIREYKSKPDILMLEELSDLNEPYRWLSDGQDPKDPFVEKWSLHPPYKSVVLDGITEVQRMSFHQVTGFKGGPGDIPNKVQRQHFGDVLSQMINFAKLYFDLADEGNPRPIHVFMSSLERTEDDTEYHKPLLWGQSGAEVGGYAYAVGRMVHRSVAPTKTLSIIESVTGVDTDNIISVALWKPSGKYVAKDQYGVLGDFMVDPSITKMLDLILGSDKN